MSAGQIVLINGTSSSGKTSLAKALQGMLAQPCFHLSVDMFQQTWPADFLIYGDGQNPAQAEGLLAVFKDDALDEVRIGPAGFRFFAGLYRSLAAWAAAGNNIIVEDVFYQPQVLREAVQALHDLPIWFVGVHCDLAVAEQRERDRGDRAPGGARTFYPLVHLHTLYDVEVDTTHLSPDACARQVKAHLDEAKQPQAFQQLARKFGLV
ncbi:MAG: AAA family ATPase [Ardenticatenaceae bacterium]|nr:AAA family ATPase [Ardenticatenaceae bacterium]